MTRIGIDCRVASESIGLGTYTRNIVKGLLSSGSPYVLFVRSTSEDWIKELSGQFELVETAYPHYSVAEQVQFPATIKRSGIDLLYSPHFNVPYVCPVPYVVTIHDLILHRFPNNTSKLKQVAYRSLMRRAVAKSSHIICVSEFTKSEVLSEYGNSHSSKATVVTEGFDKAFRKTEDKDILDFYDLTPGYFLYVGAAKQHKNVQKLIDAHIMSGVTSPLIIVTNGKEVDRLQICDTTRILLGVEHEELSALYTSAACFVTASEYEGFCLPILEARACGCPVIARNASAIPEVAGDHALLIDESHESLIMAFRNPPKQSDIPEQKYDWEKSADQISAILQSALHG